MSEYKAAIYRDKALTLETRLKELEGGLAWAANDAAADLVREAREHIAQSDAALAEVHRRLWSGRNP